MVKEQKKVTVLVAVYNGAKYLGELLDSILSGSYENIRVILSDDGSSDNSVEIIEKYEKENKRVERYISGEKFGSAASHFMHLIKIFKDEEYICLCDQDDFWFKDKIELTLKAMLENEDGPCLVHTDASVADGSLNIINPSFHGFFSMKNDLSFAERLIENNIQGSSAMLNKALASYLIEYDERVVMHDWFIALIASAVGKIVYLNKPTFLYRQHGANVVGANQKPQSFSYIFKRLGSDISKDIKKGRNQAALVCEVLENKMKDHDYIAAKTYSEGINRCKVKRLNDMKKCGIKPDSLLKKIKFFIWG